MNHLPQNAMEKQDFAQASLLPFRSLPPNFNILPSGQLSVPDGAEC